MGNCSTKVVITESMLTGEGNKRVRTTSGEHRKTRTVELDKLRQSTNVYSPENMLQFQFLVGMQENDRSLWVDLFNKIDTSGDGLISEEEVFNAMGDMSKVN